MAAELPDRFGIGWRDSIAAGIFAHLPQFDVLEVIAENCAAESARTKRSMRSLGREVPLLLHGVSCGLASVSPVETKRLERLARVADAIEPCAWSEHLSFVRSGGYEIGHLAAPPRTQATVLGALSNLQIMSRQLGSVPAVENVATLMRPVGSTMSEPQWVGAITESAAAPLLLDLHNLYANAVNFGHEPLAYLREFPLHQVQMVHISGGRWLQAIDRGGSPRLLDDHLHDVPDPVYEMLEVLGEYCCQPLTVILERDGKYPDMMQLVRQVRRARSAVALGRQRAALISSRRAANVA